MSSRAGIVGLAGFGLGVTQPLATSKLVGAARGGGGGVKGFFRQFGTGIATPFKAIGKRFNPQLANSGNETNNFKTKNFGKLKQKSLNKKLEKVRGNLNVKPITNPQTKKEIRLNKQITKLINKSPKLQSKETKFIGKIKNFGRKQNYLKQKQDIKINIKDLSKTKNMTNRVNIHNFKNDLKNAKKDFKSKTKRKSHN